MENILIAGYGEIGKGIHNLYKDYNNLYNVYTKDIFKFLEKGLFEPPKNSPVKVLQVCYPYSKTFVKDTIAYIRLYKPLLTVINSSVPLYTTEEVFKGLNEEVQIVHSPVMGKHPNLTEGIKTFSKIVGGCSNEAAELACNHFYELGVDTVVYKSSNDSEASKLLDTSYYGWNILYMKYVHKFCEDNGLDFEDVYTTTNEVYNEGYTKMGDSHYVRPILIYSPGKIGGHCVRPNFELLKNVFHPAKLGVEMDEDERTQ